MALGRIPTIYGAVVSLKYQLFLIDRPTSGMYFSKESDFLLVVAVSLTKMDRTCKGHHAHDIRSPGT